MFIGESSALIGCLVPSSGFIVFHGWLLVPTWDNTRCHSHAPFLAHGDPSMGDGSGDGTAGATWSLCSTGGQGVSCGDHCGERAEPPPDSPMVQTPPS